MVVQNVSLHQNILQRFSRLVARNRLAHAYLFIGPQDAGKFATALGIAKLINCENPKENSFCGICPVCQKIDHGNHPDIQIIESAEDEQTIKIEQIRQLTEKMQLRAFEANIKVCILKNIERITAEGSNALLKTLEEPVKNCLLILTTAVPERNLDTIRSRCHSVFFFPWSNQKLARSLSNDYAINTSAAHFLAYFSEGCLGRAQRLSESGLIQKKNETIDRLVLSLESEEYIKEVLADKAKTKETLKILLSWFRDLLLLKNNPQEMRLVNCDRLGDLRKYVGRYSFDEIDSIVQQTVDACRLLDENLNIKVALTLIKEKIWRKS